MARTQQSGGKAARKRRRGRSKAAPFLMLAAASGSAVIAAMFLLRNGGEGEDPDGLADGMPAPVDVRQIGAGGAAEITLTDRDDPSRRVAVVSFDSQTPIGQGWYDAVRPRAWIFLKDGGYLFVRADEGRFYAPNDQRPQNGTLRGNVIMRLFDPAPVRPSEDADAAITVNMRSLAFDTEYGSVRTDEPWRLTSREFDASAHDLRLVINQVQERIDLIDIRRGERLVYTPRVEPTIVSSDSTASQRGAAATPLRPGSMGRVVPASIAQPGSRSGPQGRTDYYSAQFRDGIRLSQDSLSAAGDLLEVWARVIENRIPQGPVGGGTPIASASGSGSLAGGLREILASLVLAAAERPWPPHGSGLYAPEASTAREPADAGSPGQTAGQALGHTPHEPGVPRPAPTIGLDEQAPMTLEWTGPLTVRPLTAEPLELRREHIVARLTGGSGGGVNIADSESGATGLCARLDYGFTTRSVALSGVGDTGTVLTAGPGESGRDAGIIPAGTLRSGRWEYALATGIGRVPGPGTLEGRDRDRISWSRQMHFVLGMIGDRVAARLEEVIFQGDVRGEDGGASFESDYARAEFAPVGSGDSILSVLTLEDRVRARGPDQERLDTQRMRIEFEPDDRNQPRPSWFEADGGVIATRPGDRLSARQLEAALGAGRDGQAELRTLQAHGQVDLRSRSEGVEIVGDALDADVPGRRLFVTGNANRPARIVRGATSIGGLDVRLLGDPAAADVFGPGTFAHEQRARADEPPRPGRAAPPLTRFEAAWTQHMVFKDDRGDLRCYGDVVATMREGAYRRDRLVAWSVEARLEPRAAATTPPAGEGEAAEAGTTTLAASEDDGLGLGDDRKILSVVAIGSLADSEDGEPATVESRRYGPSADGGDLVLQELHYIEGARILADNVEGTLDVPGRGRLLIVDRRTQDNEERAPTGDVGAGVSARGDALFDWQGSMRALRAEGRMTMTDRVRMTHRRAGDDLTTHLEAPVLTAAMAPQRPGEPGRLRHVSAHGGVWVRSGDQEVTAEVVEYDADSGVLTARAADGGTIRVMEGAMVWNPRAIRWDMASGRIEVIDPGGVVSPR